MFIATPNTLMPLLSILGYMWQLTDQNMNAKEISRLAASVYDKLRLFIGSFDKIDRALLNAAGAFDKAKTQLYSGRGNAVATPEKMRDLGVSVKKVFPENATTAAERGEAHDGESVLMVEEKRDSTQDLLEEDIGANSSISDTENAK